MKSVGLDEFQVLCRRGTGFGPGPTSPDGTEFITG